MNDNKNIAFHYLYRDGANYKNFNSIVFNADQSVSLEELKSLIKSKLVCGEWFYVDQWKMPDLHFGTWDNEIDHTFHEFEDIEYTNEVPNTLLSVVEFIDIIKKR